MKYKMICIDVDGTLMGHKRVISEESKRVLRDAHKNGTEIVITTGRPYNNAANISKKIGIEAPVIAANGAIIRDKYTDKIIYECPFSEEVCRSLIEKIKSHKVIAQFYTTDKIFCNTFIGMVFDKIFTTRGAEKEFMMKVKWIKSYKNLLKVLLSNSSKILKCVVIEANKEKLRLFREDILQIEDLDCFRSGGRALEIISKDVSKGNAVKRLASYLGYSRDEIICIGDNENDISMIEFAGLGVAMGNAIEEVKEIADYVTDTNVNDGVAKVVKKFIENK